MTLEYIHSIADALYLQVATGESSHRSSTKSIDTALPALQMLPQFPQFPSPLSPHALDFTDIGNDCAESAPPISFYHMPYSSLPHKTLRFCLSSRACLRLLPHRALISSRALCCCAFLSGLASQIMATKNSLQSNFCANFFLDHVNGSSCLNRRISAISSSFR